MAALRISMRTPSLLVVLELFLLINNGRTISPCPDNCACTLYDSTSTGIILVVDCTRKGLDHIPENIPCDVKELQLDINYVFKIQKMSFGECHSDLRKLSLKYNLLHHIEENAFSYLDSLNVLILSNNFLASMPYLGPIHNLVILDLSWNEFRGSPLQQQEDLQHEFALDSIDLRYNSIVSLKIPRWTRVQLTGNNIVRLSEGMFEKPQDVISLKLESNELEMVGNMRSFLKLFVLSLSHNKIRNISDDAFLNLPHLNILELKGNRIADISSIRNMPSLTTIRLAQNNIQFIRYPALSRLPKLISLDLSQNRILHGVPQYVIFSSSISLLLGENNMKKFDTNVLQGRNSLKVLNLISNRLQNISFVDFESLEKIVAGNNMLKSVMISNSQLHLKYADFSHNTLTNLTTFHNFPSLQSIWFHNNLIAIWDSTYLASSPVLRILRLEGNLLQGIQKFTNLPSLRYLDLSDNLLENISDFAFDGNPRLEKLVMRGNKLSILRFLLGLDSVRFLDLSQNRIEVLQIEIFSNLLSLHTLLLSDNKILELVPIQCPMLTTLVLSSNEISRINISLSSHFQSLSLLDLQNNMLTQFESTAEDLTIYIDDNFIGTSNSTFLVGSVIFARNNNLTRIPNTTLNARLKTLHLSKNIISRIDNDTFHSATALHYLYLAENIIEFVGETAFRGLHSVYTINLDRNHIAHLHSNLFSPCSRLRHLSLSGNPLRDLSFFQSLIMEGFKFLNLSSAPLSSISAETMRYVKEVSYLDLTNSTVDVDGSFKVNNITPVVFPKLEQLYLARNHLDTNSCLGVGYTILAKHLSRLDLSSNNFDSFPRHCLFVSTKHYDAILSDNKIRSLCINSFSIKTQFHSLYLDHNRIVFLGKGTFRFQRALKILDLRNNHLTSLSPISLIKSHKSLFIQYQGNPWKCDCSLMTLLEAFPYTWPNLVCTDPPALKNSSLSILRPSDLVCPPALCAESHATLIAFNGEKNLQLSCPIIPDGNVSIHWAYSATKNNSSSDFENLFPRQVSVRPDNSLFISIASADVTGTYFCHAANRDGQTVFTMELLVLNGTEQTYMDFSSESRDCSIGGRSRWLARSWQDSLPCGSSGDKNSSNSKSPLVPNSADYSRPFFASLSFITFLICSDIFILQNQIDVAVM